MSTAKNGCQAVSRAVTIPAMIGNISAAAAAFVTRLVSRIEPAQTTASDTMRLSPAIAPSLDTSTLSPDGRSEDHVGLPVDRLPRGSERQTPGGDQRDRPRGGPRSGGFMTPKAESSTMVATITVAVTTRSARWTRNRPCSVTSSRSSSCGRSSHSLSTSRMARSPARAVSSGIGIEWSLRPAPPPRSYARRLGRRGSDQAHRGPEVAPSATTGP